jgi:class 3 adenylate cyclase
MIRHPLDVALSYRDHDEIPGRGAARRAMNARIADVAGASEVLVSRTGKDLVAESGLAFEDAGEHELKGVPDRWQLYQ